MPGQLDVYKHQEIQDHWNLWALNEICEPPLDIKTA